MKNKIKKKEKRGNTITIWPYSHHIIYVHFCYFLDLNGFLMIQLPERLTFALSIVSMSCTFYWIVSLFYSSQIQFPSSYSQTFVLVDFSTRQISYALRLLNNYLQALHQCFFTPHMFLASIYLRYRGENSFLTLTVFLNWFCCYSN